MRDVIIKRERGRKKEKEKRHEAGERGKDFFFLKWSKTERRREKRRS